MMKRMGRQALRYGLGLLAAAAILTPPAAQAQITRVSSTEHRQSIGLTLGGFVVKPEDSRVAGDVLIADLSDVEPLLFDVKDFNSFSVGGEWLVGLGDYLEAGVGVGFYQKNVPSIYRNLENEQTGAEIEQNLKLRMIPMTATVRFLPLGRRGVEPYVGAGIGAINWRYSESGEFVDTSDGTLFRNTYKANGMAVGPVILAGIRAPIADVWSIGGEVRWQRAEGDTKRAESGLLGDKIDLGGWNAALTLHIRF
jgi:outer membrane protein with beta-barrel domain